jgi:putative ABC transport system ATP-binding protein
MVLLEARELTKTFENDSVFTPALQGLNFSVGQGEFVAIMGPSGSGKSTLLHILGFLDRHTSGEYFFEGKKFDDYAPEQIASVRNQKMGFVFQSFNLLPRATVLENVKLPLLYSQVNESRWQELAREAISRVGLSHRVNHESNQLSGGEKQRLAIARALVLNPQVVFADEPTGNLDSKSGEMILGYFRKLHQEGHTIMLITHDAYAASYAGRIIKLSDGKIIDDSKK